MKAGRLERRVARDLITMSIPGDEQRGDATQWYVYDRAARKEVSGQHATYEAALVARWRLEGAKLNDGERCALSALDGQGGSCPRPEPHRIGRRQSRPERPYWALVRKGLATADETGAVPVFTLTTAGREALREEEKRG